MRKNKLYHIFTVLILLVLVLSSCSNNNTFAERDNKIKVICTTFPQYDWLREIIGEEINDYEITLLTDKGTDLHSYQPSAEDIAKISNSDLFIYVGGISDEWFNSALKEAINKNIKTINLIELLGDSVKKEDFIEGMEPDEHEHEEDDEDGHDEEVRYDEHVWLSLKNAQIFVEEIKNTLIELDSENAEIYIKNSVEYSKKLTELDKEYQNVVDSARTKTVLFADRFPFRYLIDDYGLSYYAAFAGCSSETEASFETIAYLSNKTEELKLQSVLVIENTRSKLADTIISNTSNKNQKILVLDSLQSVTEIKLKDGYSYLTAMRNNLEALKEALNGGQID
jgi:zinc transport system substrate-binding protein